MRILLVDDDVNLLLSFKRSLQRRGMHVDCAARAVDALDFLKSTYYDYIVVDYMMPGNNGAWFLRHARIPQGTKVVLMTAWLRRDMINEMFHLGASGYLIKPVSTEELMLQLTSSCAMNTRLAQP